MVLSDNVKGMKFGGCKVGQVKLTRACRLPSMFVIQMVGPKWKGGQKGERVLFTDTFAKNR